MRENSDERRERRGYAILAGLLLAGLLIFNLDVIVDWTRGYIDVVALVSRTNGVRSGSPVWIEGIEAGRVTGIAFAGHGDSALIALDLRMEARVRPLIRRGSGATTAKRRVIGQPYVRIDAGPGDAAPLEEGDTIRPADPIDLDDLIARGKHYPASLDSLTTAVREVQRLAERRQPRVALLASRVDETLESAAELGETLSGGSLGQLLADPALPARVQRLQERLDQLAAAADSLGRWSEPELTAGIPPLMERADRLGEDLARLQHHLEQDRGTLARLQRDSALAVAVRGVQAQIDSLRAEGLSIGLRMLLP